jgi:hypothetical protein
MKKTNVSIIADDLGNVIRQSKNPKYGHIRLQQEKVTFPNGFMKKKVVSTLINGEMEQLQTLGWKVGVQSVNFGNIKTIEQLEPFNANDADRDLKYAGNTGVICMQGDSPIYRKTIFTEDVNSVDILVAHTNANDIRNANSTETMLDADTITKAEDFGIGSDATEEAVVVEEEVVEQVIDDL